MINLFEQIINIVIILLYIEILSISNIQNWLI